MVRMKVNERRLEKLCACGARFEGLDISIDGETWRELRKSCPTCRQKAIEEYDRQEAEVQKAHLAGLKEQWFHNSGIPKLFVNKTFLTFDKRRQPEAYKTCADYATKFTLQNYEGFPSLVLMSDKVWGVGKTHLVCAIAHALISRGQGEWWAAPVRFITEPDLFRRIQASYDKPKFGEGARTEIEDDIIRSYTHCPLLILDDVGKEERTDMKFVQRTLFSIIDGRYRNMLPMVITTNLNAAAFRQHLGGEAENEASFDRLIEMCRGSFTQMKGKTYRRKDLKEENNA